uniref:Uncharacterized protein n=1 Tax=Anguilla anguilla TaxID=7936 RepID=A0A0E9XE61_ANGAN
MTMTDTGHSYQNFHSIVIFILMKHKCHYQIYTNPGIGISIPNVNVSSIHADIVLFIW